MDGIKHPQMVDLSVGLPHYCVLLQGCNPELSSAAQHATGSRASNR